MALFSPYNGSGPCNAVLASAILTLWATVLRSFPILCKPPQSRCSIRRFHLHPQAAHHGLLRAGRGSADKALHPWFTNSVFMTPCFSRVSTVTDGSCCVPGKMPYMIIYIRSLRYLQSLYSILIRSCSHLLCCSKPFLSEPDLPIVAAPKDTKRVLCRYLLLTVTLTATLSTDIIRGGCRFRYCYPDCVAFAMVRLKLDQERRRKWCLITIQGESLCYKSGTCPISWSHLSIS